jgi:hypothetical protein
MGKGFCFINRRNFAYVGKVFSWLKKDERVSMYRKYVPFDSQSRLLFIGSLTQPICVSLRLFRCTLYKQLVFDNTLMRKGSVGRSCRAIGSKIL